MNSVNLQSYGNDHVFLYNFAWLDLSKFWTWLSKCDIFFYYTSTYASVLIAINIEAKLREVV